ncbi:MAG: type I-E CRISPR-associated protein Cas5/CasD [Acidobacteria bacterium]|nr:type I-E CRISPR-associated protein Cas5/CasD [Acidobacteriota bacterium]
MAHTLLLRLVGPMQSWGTQSRFIIRDTTLEPSKSGVIGLLCAALGKPRDETHPDNQDKPKLAELAALRMGVRVDRAGVLQKDYHTAGGSRHDDYGVVKASGAKGDTVVSTRYYLADASFFVGLESDNQALLITLDEALARPHWQLFLGRKSFVPSVPVGVGVLCDTRLEEALQTHWNSKEEKLPCVIEPLDSLATEARHDVPLSFAARRFTIRYVKTKWIGCPKGEEKNEP